MRNLLATPEPLDIDLTGEIVTSIFKICKNYVSWDSVNDCVPSTEPYECNPTGDRTCIDDVHAMLNNMTNIIRISADASAMTVSQYMDWLHDPRYDRVTDWNNWLFYSNRVGAAEDLLVGKGNPGHPADHILVWEDDMLNEGLEDKQHLAGKCSWVQSTEHTYLAQREYNSVSGQLCAHGIGMTKPGWRDIGDTYADWQIHCEDRAGFMHGVSRSGAITAMVFGFLLAVAGTTSAWYADNSLSPTSARSAQILRGAQWLVSMGIMGFAITLYHFSLQTIWFCDPIRAARSFGPPLWLLCWLPMVVVAALLGFSFLTGWRMVQRWCNSPTQTKEVELSVNTTGLQVKPAAV